MSTCTKPRSYSPDEKRIRKKMIDLCLTQADIVKALGLTKQDVSNVVCGICRSPRYVKAVYDYLGMEVPENYGKKRRQRNLDKAG